MPNKHNRPSQHQIDVEALSDNPNFYANAVHVFSSIYDVTLQFRVEAPVTIPEQGKPTMLEIVSTCSVRMSPQHAKALGAILVKHVKDYEENNHVTLPLDPKIQPMWENAVKK